MKSMVKIFAFTLVTAVLLASCDPHETQPSDLARSDADGDLKVMFARSLAKAVASEPAVRRFLKTEAQKMMDEDYDVVYQLVKDTKLGNNRTFRENLLPYFSSEGDLVKIEDRLPLLTIFVPILPEGTFSAEAWDVESQIPDVAIRLRGTNEIPIVKATGEQMILEPDLIPGYPVIVVKNNERLITEKQSGYQDMQTTRILKAPNGLSYRFVDDVFDRYLPKPSPKEAGEQRLTKPHQKLKEAFNIYGHADGWQRDYIYYGITPTHPNGQFSYDFKEYITSFLFTGDALLVYYKISEQTGDPEIKSGKRSSGWTDGFFEIRCTAVIQAQNGVGNEIKSKFLPYGQDLFDVVYKTSKRGIWPFRYTYYSIGSVTAKLVLTNMPLVNWDLYAYAATFRIDVEEVDNTEVIKYSRMETVEFATNFDVQATILKIGLKFGGSMRRTITNTIETSTTKESDELGQATVNFADKVLIGQTQNLLVLPYYATREYYNDIFSISIEPRVVQ
ncbi:hypothetical protein SAMN04488109_1170 [Chryseolinea serpens]|uniref:Uncharacterized protein n=1 Tax=Chryseolinea serpens TaxID=947013 RepID=A0A1M5LEG9_9BACT|nr:hypothetical protein [Chryseolinea serpens]SHG63504.1 hypothetical protein SAMN04488109_1170 [Chryseolinea serpens]